jgi:hypothetical protein
MKSFEVAVEFGFHFKYYTVAVPYVETGKEAKQYVWDELLFPDEKDNVSSMEVVGEQEVYAPQEYTPKDATYPG